MNAIIKPLLISFTLLLLPLSKASLAQELSPRAYWPSPIGTKAVSIGYAYSSGDILIDPELPVEGLNADINTAVLAYFQSFNFAGRTANYILELPYVWGTVGAALDLSDYPLPPDALIPDSADFEGQGDISVTLSVNLKGAPAMNKEEFRALLKDPESQLGIGLKVTAPTGDYDKDKKINVGRNRWAAKTEMGYINSFSKNWIFELESGFWWFGDNKDHPDGSKGQDTIYSLETHLIRIFNPGMWGSLDVNYYRGGSTSLNGEADDNKQHIAKVGLSLAFPVSRKQTVKMSIYEGGFNDSDNDFWGALITFSHRLE